MFAKSIFSTGALAIALVAAQDDKTGWTGTIDGLDGGLEGTVSVVDDMTLQLSDFTIVDASAPALYWWGSVDENVSDGFRISNEQVTESAEGSDLEIKLDAGMTTDDFSYVSLWCERLNVNFGSAMLEEGGAGDSPSSDGDSASPTSDSEPPANTKEGGASALVGSFTGALAVAGFIAAVIV